MELPKEAQAEVKKAQGILKLLKGLQKFVAKEFIWVFAAVLFSFPIGLLLLFVLDVWMSGLEEELETIENLDVLQVYLLCYILAFAGIYLLRTMISALKVMAQKAASDG